ncbi:MAG: hypothetical protein ACHQM4_06280 [Thermoanaerobaculia bacterium]
MASLRRRLAGGLAALLFASANAAGPVKTEVLPATGGDLGKAYVELAAAMKAGDKDRAGRLLDPRHWHLADKQKSWFGMFAYLEEMQPAGGRLQGDRGTLFLANKAGNPLEYRFLSATRTSRGWQFDSPTTFGSSFSKGEARDCKTSRVFPCGARTAPDSVVSGTITPRNPDPNLPASYRVIDGLAVQMVGAPGATPTSTRVLLSIHGITPEAVALSGDPDEVKGWLAWPVVSLDIAKGGGSARLDSYDGMSRRSFEIATGLTLEAAAPDRVRGQLKTEIEKVVFDLYFDLAAGSSCRSNVYRCGPDAAP